MMIYETLDKNGKVIYWNCIHDDDTRERFSVGDLFLKWCARDAEQTEKTYNDLQSMDTEWKDLFLKIVPEEWLIKDKAPVYFESPQKEKIRICLENNDMMSLYEVVEYAVKDHFRAEIEKWSLGLRDRVEQSTVTVEPFFLADYHGLEKSNIRYGKCYTINSPSLPWLDSFVLIDLQEVIAQNLKFHVCNHCYRVYIKNGKNQRYCTVCQNKNIAELKKQASITQRLHRKIYNRLAYRDGQKFPLGDEAGTFSKNATEYRESHTRDQYIEWLQMMDKETKSGTPLVH